MENIKKTILFFALFFVVSSAFSSQTKSATYFQTTEPNYMILYVETNDSVRINAFINEMIVLTDKVVDARYSYTTHEFTILFTNLLRNDTIYQILLKYFDDFNEVDGKYPIY